MQTFGQSLNTKSLQTTWNRRNVFHHRGTEIKFCSVSLWLIHPGQSIHLFCLALHIIHQYVLAQVYRAGEIRLSATNLCDLLHEIDQVIIVREHKRVDEYSGFPAGGNFLESLVNYSRIQSERILVNAAVIQRHRRRFPVGDHNDLSHILALSLKQSTRKL